MSKQPLIKQGNLRTVDIEGEEWLVYLLNPIKKIVLEQDEIPPAMTPEPTPPQELEKLYQSDHSIGSHSDDRGGSADFPCYCQVKKRIEAYIKQHELSRKQEWVESLIKKLPNRKAKSFIKTVHLTNDEYKYSSAFKDGHNACLDQVIKTIKEQSKALRGVK